MASHYLMGVAYRVGTLIFVVSTLSCDTSLDKSTYPNLESLGRIA